MGASRTEKTKQVRAGPRACASASVGMGVHVCMWLLAFVFVICLSAYVLGVNPWEEA
jgi:hypothetical protein